MESSDLSMLLALDALLSEVSVTAAARRLGLSTPATSHALARIRERLGDPLLVRAGRGMVLTPRAEALRPEVRALVEQARRTLAPPRPFSPAELDRSFVLSASDYVLTVLGPAVDRSLRDLAPKVSLRVVPNASDDPARLRDGTADLAVGIYGELPPEMRVRELLTDRFVCVARRAHPEIGRRLTLARFLELPHVQIAPRGSPGGYVDDVLRARGQARRVHRAIPYFRSALELAAYSDDLLVVSERIARALAPSLGLEVHEVPLPLRPYALSLVWHPRFDADEGHRFLRERFLEAAQRVAGDRHPSPRRRLDPSDPTSGERRRRPRRSP